VATIVSNAHRPDSFEDRLDREQHSDRGHRDDDQLFELLMRREGDELLEGLIQHAEKRGNETGR
jgi:hypothetical protein